MSNTIYVTNQVRFTENLMLLRPRREQPIARGTISKDVFNLGLEVQIIKYSLQYAMQRELDETTFYEKGGNLVVK